MAEDCNLAEWNVGLRANDIDELSDMLTNSRYMTAASWVAQRAPIHDKHIEVSSFKICIANQCVEGRSSIALPSVDNKPCWVISVEGTSAQLSGVVKGDSSGLISGISGKESNKDISRSSKLWFQKDFVVIY